MPPHMTNEQVLKANPKVDVNVALEFQRIARELATLGVDLSTKYTLSPPLSGDALETNIKVGQNRSIS